MLIHQTLNAMSRCLCRFCAMLSAETSAFTQPQRHKTKGHAYDDCRVPLCITVDVEQPAVDLVMLICRLAFPLFLGSLVTSRVYQGSIYRSNISIEVYMSNPRLPYLHDGTIADMVPAGEM